VQAWGSPKIPIWGIVKKEEQSEDSGGNVYLRQTELVSFTDNGAYSHIKDTPRLVSRTDQKKMSRDFKKVYQQKLQGQVQP
jgi:hypothetical protein